jgi:hypothetical protein
MFLKKYKIPLEIISMNPISENSHRPHEYSCYRTNLGELDLKQSDIDDLGGQYDWIDAWMDDEYHKQMSGFNNKDVLMEVIYNKGYYIVTLVSDKPFDTIVKNNRYCDSNRPWEEVTLEEAVVRYIKGCLSDGIGENPIGYIEYQGEVCDVWMIEKLIEM